MRNLIVFAAMLMVAAVLVVTTSQAQAKNAYWVGHITHVSTANLKVEDSTGKELSFLIVPKFKNIWSDDGKTTYQTSYLKPGMKVQVIFDQTALGARHADKIIVLRS
jgi:hypothetical protein